MRRSKIGVVLGIVAACSVAPFASHPAAAATDEEKCLARSLKESGRYFRCITSQRATAVKQGTAPDFSRCQARLSSKLARLTAKYGTACPSFAPLGDVVDACLDEVEGVLTTPSPTSTPHPVPSATSTPTGVNLVFVTSTIDIGGNGVGGAEAACAQLATAAGLDGTFAPWISGTPSVYGNASQRLPHSPLPYVRVDGVRVANDWDGLVSGSLLAPINVTEEGVSVPPHLDTVWTGTLANGGEAVDRCLDWTVEHVGTFGMTGRANATDFTWTAADEERCNNGFRYYCVQQQ